MLEILSGIIQVIVEILIIGTARFVLPRITFGRFHVRPAHDRTAGLWHFFKRQPDGTVLVGEIPAMLVGVVVWVSVILFLWVILGPL